MAEEKNKKNEGRGFAGLSSLVSDLDSMPTQPRTTESAGAATSTESNASITAQTQASQSTARPSSQEPPQSSSSFSTWVLVVVAFCVLLVIGESNKSTRTAAPAYSPPAQVAATPSQSLPVQTQAQPELKERKPPVGQDIVLSSDQIRYCIAENFRMEGAKSILNSQSNTDVDRFNAMVDDYNSRCASFRYKSGALENARRDVEKHRSKLQAEGMSRFALNPSKKPLSAPASKISVADDTVRAIQQKLNELGYNAGRADGVMGRDTRSAIRSFQKDNGYLSDGIPSSALLQILTVRSQIKKQERNSSSVAVVTQTYRPTNLEQTPKTEVVSSSDAMPLNARMNALGNGWECNNGYFKYGSECRRVEVPRNGKLTYLGNDWECNKGYYKYLNECRAVQVPQNGKLTYLGDDWECNKGYYKYLNECRAVQVPQNGKLNYLGNDWECNEGYYKNLNECRAVQVPQNGKLNYLGTDWECNEGYYKYLNQCRAVQVPLNGALNYLGNDWVCNEGYYKDGNECRAVQVPQNGKLNYLGNDWECEKGYRKDGDECVSAFQQ